MKLLAIAIFPYTGEDKLQAIEKPGSSVNMLTPSPPGERHYLQPGDPAPNFIQNSFSGPRIKLDENAGSYIVICFFGSLGDPQSSAALQAVLARPDLFDGANAQFLGISIDPEDETSGRIENKAPGYRFVRDFDLSVSRLYGAISSTWTETQLTLTRQWIILDPTLRVISAHSFRDDQGDIAEVLALLNDLPPPERASGTELMAPILLLPRVFEPELCQSLIELYEKDGGEDTGFMMEIDGRTVHRLDPDFKSRTDLYIEQEELIRTLQHRIRRRVFPEISKAYQFQVTRMERYLVSCYSAEAGGHFSPHRDNSTKGTAHRRFAVSINLNQDFEGGEIGFPEYGPRRFKAPLGAAIVFSCSLLHTVERVTSGKRYAFLPFLYDEAAARVREANIGLIDQPSPEKTEA